MIYFYDVVVHWTKISLMILINNLNKVVVTFKRYICYLFPVVIVGGFYFPFLESEAFRKHDGKCKLQRLRFKFFNHLYPNI